MEKERSNPPQFSLILRLLGGGYLVYLAWGLRDSFRDGPLFIVAAAVFGIVGLALVIHAGLKLLRKEYTTGSAFAEETADCEVQSDEQDESNGAGH